MTERTIKGAEAAAASYFAALDYAFATGDTSPISAMSTPECVSCKGQIEAIERVYADGGHYTSRQTTVNASIALTKVVQNPTVVTVSFIGTPMIKYAQGSNPIQTFSSNEEFSYKFDMKLVGDRWLIDEITGLQS